MSLRLMIWVREAYFNRAGLAPDGCHVFFRRERDGPELRVVRAGHLVSFVVRVQVEQPVQLPLFEVPDAQYAVVSAGQELAGVGRVDSFGDGEAPRLEFFVAVPGEDSLVVLSLVELGVGGDAGFVGEELDDFGGVGPEEDPLAV